MAHSALDAITGTISLRAVKKDLPGFILVKGVGHPGGKGFYHGGALLVTTGRMPLMSRKMTTLPCGYADVQPGVAAAQPACFSCVSKVIQMTVDGFTGPSFPGQGRSTCARSTIRAEVETRRCRRRLKLSPSLAELFHGVGAARGEGKAMWRGGISASS